MTEVNQPFFRRRPRTTLLAIAFVGTAVVLGLGEWTLRLSGYLPGSTYFTVTPELTVQEMFTTDAKGVFRANPAFWASTTEVSINSDGFRGPEFSSPDPGQRSVLVLGDSQAWGIGASPLTNAFPDLIRAAGFRVYNSGVPGVGPSQYALIADLYVPRLKPTDVIVSLYVGNDLMDKLYPVIPGHNLIHVTNAGWILGFDACDKPLTAQEAYDYYIGVKEPLVQRLLLSTSIGTAAWNLFTGSASREPASTGAQTCADGSDIKPSPPPAAPAAATFEALQHISELATANGARFHLLVIPAYGAGCSLELNPYRQSLDRLNPIYLDDMPEGSFYDAPNCHMTNEGHRFVADRVVSRLK